MRLYATLVKQTPGDNEVRHLLIQESDGPGKTNLSQLTAGVQTPIATGTQFEMIQKADQLTQLWTANEGFKFPKEGTPVFESLDRTIALAKIMGYTTVYDSKYKNLTGPDPRRLNATGEVPLTGWPGQRSGKSGGGYEYAFEGMKIIANPALPRDHGLNMAPKTNEEFFAVMKQAIALKAAIGPTVEFLLGGETF